jgi:hypothetical protein
MANRRISPETFEQARQMLTDGRTRIDISKTLGIGTTTLNRHFPNPRAGQATAHPVEPDNMDAASEPPAAPPTAAGGKPRPDPAPRSKRSHRRKPDGPTDEQLEGMVRKVAKAPAIPAALWLRCDFCATHFRETAGPLAAELVQVSHEDQDLREILEWCFTSWRRYAWAGMLLSWLGVPLIHHAAPNRIYGVAGPLMGMPPRQPRHDHGPARPMPAATPYDPTNDYGFAAPAPGQAPPVVPVDPAFAQMLEQMPDVSQILDLAAGLGVQLPPDVLEFAATLGTDGQTQTSVVDAAAVEITRDEQERDLAAAAAEAAAAQAAALAAD